MTAMPCLPTLDAAPDLGNIRYSRAGYKWVNLNWPFGIRMKHWLGARVCVLGYAYSCCIETILGNGSDAEGITHLGICKLSTILSKNENKEDLFNINQYLTDHYPKISLNLGDAILHIFWEWWGVNLTILPQGCASMIYIGSKNTGISFKRGRHGLI